MRTRSLSLLSILIPARDEESCVAKTIEDLCEALTIYNIPFEIIAIDDGSRDNTFFLLKKLELKFANVFALQTPAPFGIGRAISFGLNFFKGDAVVIFMADA